MTKLIFALWPAPPASGGGPLHTALHDASLHARLAGLGLTRIQVNVDDDAVVGAMRIPASEPPIGAVVSTWDDVDPAAVVSALVDATGARVAGWEVSERRPIDPPESWDGTRVDTLANIAVLRRPADLSVEDYRRIWLVDHTPVAIATQGTFGYVQNAVERAVTPDAPEVAAIVEELFPMAGITDIHAFYGSTSEEDLHDRMTRLMASVARFGADQGLDLVPTSRYLYSLSSSSTEE